MPPNEGAEKTEAPTPRRLDEARQEGNLARSPDFHAGLLLFGAAIILWLGADAMFGSMRTLVRMALSGQLSDDWARTDDLGAAWAAISKLVLPMVAPLMVGLFVIAIIGGLMQVGFLVTAKPLMPKFSKLNPLQGFKQLVNLKAMVRLLMSLLKVSVVAVLIWLTIQNDLPQMMHLGYLGASAMMLASGELIIWMVLKVAALLLLLGVIDYVYQKWQHQQDLKMSKQDVKDEMKQMDGDPMIKQRRAKLARQMAMQQLNRTVPQADVIVTNPTHFSVALSYDSETMVAPQLIAKGADLLAMRIRQLAAQHEIPIVERPPLARAIFRDVEVGEQIPEEHFTAVAEILAYVYRLNEGKKTA